MYLNQVFKLSSSVAKRRRLLKKLRSNNSSVMRLCNHCFNRFVKCCVDTDFDRCVECVRLDRKCDLIVSETKWERIRKKRAHLRAELSETLTKAARLQKQQELIESRWENMMRRKFKNIEELEKNERRQTTESSINDLLLNVDFEQLEIPSDFDWLSNFFAEIVEEASDSSWDFSLIFKCSRYDRNLFTWSINETDLWCSVDLVCLLLRIRRSDSLNQFLKILFELMYSSLQTSKDRCEISNVFS